MPAQRHHHHCDSDEGEVPEDIKDDDRLGVGPVAAPLLQVRGCGLADEHRGLSHHAAGAGPADEGGSFVEGLTAEVVAAGWGGDGGGEEGGCVGGGGW